MPLQLRHFEGPLDLLLLLAREQKVDLLAISIVELADQYLAFIGNLQDLQLAVAADYLVMASWLAFLKSRLLIPKEQREVLEEAPEIEAERLALRLRHLELLRKYAVELWDRPQLRRDFFTFGKPLEIAKIKQTEYQDSLYDLLSAYGEFHSRDASKELRILPTNLYSAEELRKDFQAKLEICRDWTEIDEFLPPARDTALQSRSALAATLAVSLEMARQGHAQLRQAKAFSRIYIKPTEKDKAHA